MKNFIAIVLCLQVVLIYAAPSQLQWRNQMSAMPTQEEMLQAQVFALQQLQLMNQLSNNGYPPLMQKSVPPVIIIMPIENSNSWLDTNNLVKNAIKDETKENETNDLVTQNLDLDSITVEAADPKPEMGSRKAILLIPNRGRFSIGGLISTIPFLPIEINVPDTISWIYNGIASIISGIGQSFPFYRPSQMQMPQENMRILLNKLQSKSQNNLTPILMLPEVAQMYPQLI